MRAIEPEDLCPSKEFLEFVGIMFILVFVDVMTSVSWTIGGDFLYSVKRDQMINSATHNSKFMAAAPEIIRVSAYSTCLDFKPAAGRYCPKSAYYMDYTSNTCFLVSEVSDKADWAIPIDCRMVDYK